MTGRGSVEHHAVPAVALDVRRHALDGCQFVATGHYAGCEQVSDFLFVHPDAGIGKFRRQHLEQCR